MRRWLTATAYAVLCLGAVVSAASLYGLLRDVRLEVAADRASGRDDIVWLASQYRFELSELIHALEHYSYGVIPITGEEVRERLDVFWSRLDSSGRGDLGRLYFTMEGAQTTVRESRPLLEELDRLLKKDSPRDSPGLRAAIATLHEFEPRFRAVAFAALRYREDEAVARAQALDSRTSRIGYLSAGAIALAAGVVLLLLFERSRASALRTHLQQRFEHSTIQLRQSEQRFRALAEAAPEAVVVMDSATGLLVDANENAASLFKRPVQELIGAAPALLSPPRQPDGRDSEKAVRQYFKEAMDGGKPCFEWIHRNGDGEDVLCEIRLVAMPAGDRLHVRGSLTDITQRRRAERELARHQQELEVLVAERTRELAEAQRDLLRSERLAAIGELTGTVSHELRNPLGTISASFTVLRARMGDGDERMQRNLDRIDRNIRRCVKIIDELLDYARLRAISPSAVQLDPWLGSVLKELKVPEGVILEQRLDCGARVLLDRDRMRQVMVNLAQNAFNAVAEIGQRDGSGRVGVLTSMLGDTVQIRVQDNGPGVPEADRERIFEPLFSTRSFGVGLGLPLVRRIVEQHQGHVVMDAAPDGGAELVVSLPARVSPANQRAG